VKYISDNAFIVLRTTFLLMAVLLKTFLMVQTSLCWQCIVYAFFWSLAFLVYSVLYYFDNEERRETGAIARPLTSESLLWVDKYKPTERRQIIGQQGDKSNAKKLLSWLQHWRENYNKKPACKNSIYNTRSIIGRFCDVNYLYVHIVKKQSFL